MLGGTGTEKLFSLKMLGEGGIKKSPITQNVRRG